MNERSYLIKLIGNTVYSSKINTISYIIINVILTLLLVATTVLYNSLSALMTNTINNKIDCRTIFAKGYDESISRDILLESIKSANKHISTAAFQDYAFSVGEILEIKTSERDGEIYIYGCDDTTMPELSRKIDVFPDNYCIIPEKLYADRSYERSIDKSLYVNGEDYLGKTVTISLVIEHFDGDSTITQIGTVEHEFIVAGTYDAVASYTNDNVCFMSFDNVKMLNDSTDDGSIERGMYPILVYVDDVRNVDDVLSSLSSAGLRVNVRSEMNTSAPRIIKIITDGICVAVYCFCGILSIALLVGMVKKSKSKIALMKSFGYSNNFILKTYLKGYGILILFGYATGIICAVISSIIIKNTYLVSDFSFSKMEIIFSAGAITIPLFLLFLIPVFSLFFITKRINNISPLELWVNDRI